MRRVGVDVERKEKGGSVCRCWIYRYDGNDRETNDLLFYKKDE